jgi:hypothetical protein
MRLQDEEVVPDILPDEDAWLTAADPQKVTVKPVMKLFPFEEGVRGSHVSEQGQVWEADMNVIRHTLSNVRIADEAHALMKDVCFLTRSSWVSGRNETQNWGGNRCMCTHSVTWFCCDYQDPASADHVNRWKLRPTYRGPFDIVWHGCPLLATYASRKMVNDIAAKCSDRSWEQSPDVTWVIPLQLAKRGEGGPRSRTTF